MKYLLWKVNCVEHDPILVEKKKNQYLQLHTNIEKSLEGYTINY